MGAFYEVARLEDIAPGELLRNGHLLMVDASVDVDARSRRRVVNGGLNRLVTAMPMRIDAQRGQAMGGCYTTSERASGDERGRNADERNQPTSHRETPHRDTHVPVLLSSLRAEAVTRPRCSETLLLGNHPCCEQCPDASSELPGP